eukprot:m.160283 g.160283  ORF g.160283 m.160283 type:complete len:369 (+) comp13383_c3_seq1:104-1210(+)
MTDVVAGSEEKENIVHRVSDAIKQIQIAYTGTSTASIATSADTRVVCLLSQLDAMLCHGLKHKRNTELSFWQFVRTFIPQSEVKDITLLKNITTDSGRGRAWLRGCLNDQSMRTHIHQMVEHIDHAKTYYEPHAFVLDEEKMETVAMLFQGLDTHFMLEMDTQEIDSVRTADTQHQKSQEDVVEAKAKGLFSTAVEPQQITVVKHVKKKKKKKKKQKSSSTNSTEEDIFNESKPSSTSPLERNDGDASQVISAVLPSQDEEVHVVDASDNNDDNPYSSPFNDMPDLSTLTVEDILKQVVLCLLLDFIVVSFFLGFFFVCGGYCSTFLRANRFRLPTLHMTPQLPQVHLLRIFLQMLRKKPKVTMLPLL